MKFVRLQQDVLLLFFPQVIFVDLPVKDFRNFFGQLIKIHFRSLMHCLVNEQNSITKS